MTFGTKNLDSQSVEVCHFLQGLNNANIDVPMNHHFAKPADGVVSCMGCCIYLWLNSVVNIQMQDKTERAADLATFGGLQVQRFIEIWIIRWRRPARDVWLRICHEVQHTDGEVVDSDELL